MNIFKVYAKRKKSFLRIIHIEFISKMYYTNKQTNKLTLYIIIKKIIYQRKKMTIYYVK